MTSGASGTATVGGAFVGRRRELDAVRRAIADVGTGRGRLILISGEPGIGKTRLAQEIAGLALSAGVATAWGRCADAEGAPAYWPWRQALRALGADADEVIAGEIESPEERFRVFDTIAETIVATAGSSGVLVVIDDAHWADESSLLVLRHLADRLASAPVLVVATCRDVEQGSPLPRVLPDLLRAPATERIDLGGFTLAEVEEQLVGAVGEAPTVLEVTGGNPLFVGEIARAIADGTWQPERPPRSVLDVVAGRVERMTPDARRFVQAAAIVGRDFTVQRVAGALGVGAEQCLPRLDEAMGHGLVVPGGDGSRFRFVHALTRDAVEASMSSAERLDLHRAVAAAIEAEQADDLGEDLTDLARHWLVLAPYGEGARAREWAVRAADEAVRRLAYEEGVRLYRAAIAVDPTETSGSLPLALGRAAYLAGDLGVALSAAQDAAAAARAAADPVTLGEAALVLEPVPDPAVNAVLDDLCEEALARLVDEHPALRARLLAQRSHLAFYAGDVERTDSSSRTALDLARSTGDDRALVDALRARQEACPGPDGRDERRLIAEEMAAAATRTGSARNLMWSELWRIEVLTECGDHAAAAERLGAFQVAVERVGGPVSRWHLERTIAGIAQAQSRYDEALIVARSAYERMRRIEPGPATGAFLALQTAISCHVRMDDHTAAFARAPVVPVPRFLTMGRISRTRLLLNLGYPDEAASTYREAGPIEAWSFPVFFVVAGITNAVLSAIDLGLTDDVEVLLDRLERFRGEHATANAVSYMGPAELAIGRAEAFLGRIDAAVADLELAVDRAERAGSPGYATEARHHLADALLRRDAPGDRQRAADLAGVAARDIEALGMTAYGDRSADLLARLGGAPPSDASALSRREAEVAALVAEGLTNRQIAERLVLSERTAQNHVQHILTKLGFSSRSQIAAWVAARPK